MAGTIVSNYATGDENLTALMNTTTQQRKGADTFSLTEIDTTAIPKIAEGSVIEINNSLAVFNLDESITDPGVSDGVIYIKLVPSGSSVTAQFDDVAPFWDSNKQGWYSTASGEDNYRFIAKMDLSSGTYLNKEYLSRPIIYQEYSHYYDHFSAYKNTSQSISASGVTVLTFDTVLYDRKSNYDATSLYTIDTDGWYNITARFNAQTTNIADSGVLILYVDSGTSSYKMFEIDFTATGSGGEKTISDTFTHYFSATQTIELALSKSGTAGSISMSRNLLAISGGASVGSFIIDRLF